MGLPTACLFLEAGAKVLGVDTDERVVELLNNGKSPIEEEGVQPIIERHIGSTFSVTSDLREAAALSKIIHLVVPTSIDAGHKPDYSAVEKVAHEIGFKLSPGCLVILESTVAPGVTEEIVKPLLERNSGLTAGKDFLLAYSPIRAMSGRGLRDIRTYPRIIGGLDERSLNATSTVMGTIVEGGIIKVRNIRTAEAVKLFENVYRDVNIALANELACLCEGLGLDFLTIREAANSQPHCHLHVPGVGVGGHCIPVNPYFLIASGRKVGMDLRLVRYGRLRNDRMPGHTVELVEAALKESGRTIGRSTVAVLGISYRANVKESRNSPSLEVVRRLRRMGGRVRVFDPYFGAEELKEMGYISSDSLERAVQGVNCLLVAVGHDQFKGLPLEHLARLMRKPACVVDGARVVDPEEARRHGLVYYGVGYGWEQRP
jgi:nucleotide sugar dehydrogenase